MTNGNNDFEATLFNTADKPRKNKDLAVIDNKEIQNHIFAIRGLQVMLDRDLAELYGVETKVLNQAVKRNIERFPEQFRFQLTKDELENLGFQNGSTSLGKHYLRSQSVTLDNDSLKFKNGTLNAGRGRYSKYLPYAFTEQGISMLSAVLRSKTAVRVSIQIMDTFVNMRRFIANNAEIFHRLNTIEQKQPIADTILEKVFEAMDAGEIKPKQGIFFDGQIFDAYVFVANLVKSAKKLIVLIDNYVDETVLTLLSKRSPKCTASIYTRKFSKKLQLDLEKHNQQYPPIEIKTFNYAHDRFLIMDNSDIYHFGASLKDFGKKWFAFSKFEKGALEVLGRLNKETI